MNPGIIEETGQTARSLINSLKSQPALLGLVLFNLVFMVAIFFSVQQEREFNGQIIGQLIKNSEKAQEMLFKCIEPRIRDGRAEDLTTIPIQMEE